MLSDYLMLRLDASFREMGVDEVTGTMVLRGLCYVLTLCGVAAVGPFFTYIAVRMIYVEDAAALSEYVVEHSGLLAVLLFIASVAVQDRWRSPSLGYLSREHVMDTYMIASLVAVTCLLAGAFLPTDQYWVSIKRAIFVVSLLVIYMLVLHAGAAEIAHRWKVWYRADVGDRGRRE